VVRYGVKQTLKVRRFTLNSYRKYIELIIDKYERILRFDEYFSLEKLPDSFVILRHDVDRMPKRAFRMAQVEHSLGVPATYYFRIKNHTFNPEIIIKISELGHEIGYHYECLSDADGDMERALDDFKYNLDRLRKIVPIKTISMHGRPFKKQDNRDMWKNAANNKFLKDELKILGEVYLDIDYKDIAYINDTGRNWLSNKSNMRDKIISNINADFNNDYEVFSALKDKKFKKIIFQIHPERWNDELFSWSLQYSFDSLVNIAKSILK